MNLFVLSETVILISMPSYQLNHHMETVVRKIDSEFVLSCFQQLVEMQLQRHDIGTVSVSICKYLFNDKTALHYFDISATPEHIEYIRVNSDHASYGVKSHSMTSI